MQSKLPLDVAYLLSKMTRYKGAKFKMQGGRGYEHLWWLDNRVEKPSLEELEAAFMHLHDNPTDDYVDPSEIEKYLMVKPTFWQRLKSLFK